MPDDVAYLLEHGDVVDLVMREDGGSTSTLRVEFRGLFAVDGEPMVGYLANGSFEAIALQHVVDVLFVSRDEVQARTDPAKRSSTNHAAGVPEGIRFFEDGDIVALTERYSGDASTRTVDLEGLLARSGDQDTCLLTMIYRYDTCADCHPLPNIVAMRLVKPRSERDPEELRQI